MKELRTKSIEELLKMLTDKREALRVFRYAVVGSKVRNVREGRTIRETISHILTLLNQGDNAPKRK